jgi:uncharacterized membrane protein
MRNISEQPQVQYDEERGYAPQQPPEYYEGDVPSSGYQPYYQGQQYQYKQPNYVPEPGDVGPFEMTSMGMRARTSGLLCYLFGWVGGLVFFLLERQNRFVRFHAIQSILFFGTMSILGWVCSYFPFVLFGFGGVVGLVSLIAWIVLMVAAHRGRYYRLPLFGYYAEKLANQPRT